MGTDRPFDGARGVDAQRGSAWGSHVPGYVIQLLRTHRDEIPVATGEPADVVVLFADVAGFTPMSEALARSGDHGTEELTGILNEWFDAMSGTIARHTGAVAEFAGDALVGVFDCDGRRETARRAVRCALEMQAEMARFQPLATRAGPFRLAMKVGLAAGPLLQTVMGDLAVRLGFVLVGPALERAAAAEHHAQGDEVVVDDGLLDELRGDQVSRRDGRWWLVHRTRAEAAPAPSAPNQVVDESVAARLAPFLHPAIADRLRSGRRELVNEHRKVTAVFVGLQHVAVDDREAVSSLQRYLAAAVRLIAHYDGHFRHLAVGDGGHVLVAFFGAPVSHEDDEERAVRCTLELLGLPGGPHRAGLATGPVYCGEVGTDIRREYAVIGDSVNLAARLMQLAQDGQLLVDETTHEQLRDHAEEDRLSPVVVKGKTGPVDVWAVRALREPLPADLPARVPGPVLLGRATEVAICRELVGRVLGGSGHVLAFSGDAGIGKSRLAAEVVDIARRDGFSIFGGACRSHGAAGSYLVWRSIWRDLLGLDLSLPVADLHRQLVDRLATHTADAARRAPLLAPVLNLPMPDTELIAPLDPQTRDGLLRSLLLECLRHRASSTPVVIVLEDCHWIDPASSALLEFLTHRLGDQRVLVLLTSRSTVTTAPTSLSLPADSTEIPLDELSGTDAARLVDLRLRQRFPAAAFVDPAVVRQIAVQSEGNPFYLGELVNYLYAKDPQSRHPRTLETGELPHGLQRLLMARLDQLSEGEKATIKVASVIGRRFTARWIADAYPAVGGPPEVARHLERLHVLDLTPRRSSGSEPEYQFKHAMTQEAAYQSLTFRMRESLHERVGLLIEAVDPEGRSRDVDLLAHHYGRTQRVDKQRLWFRAAGDAAKAAFANEAAVDYYDRLLPLLPADETGDVLVEMGGVWHLTGKWAEAEQAYRRAMEVAGRAGRPEILAAGQRDLGDLYMYNRSYGEAVTWLRRAVDEFERLDDRAGLSRTLDRLTFALLQQGAYEEALTTAERHRTLTTRAGDVAGMSIALNHTGLVYLLTRRSAEARALLQQALDTAARTTDRRCLLHAATNLALAHAWDGEHMPAITHGLKAFEVAQEIGFQQIAGLAIGNMGEIYRDEGDYVQATRCCAYALRIALELRDWTSVADQLANTAAAAAAQDRYEEAERLFGQAIVLARYVEAPYLLCAWLHQLATVLVAQGRFDNAEELSREALGIAETHGERDVQVRASVLAQRLAVELGRTGVDEAIASLRGFEDLWTQSHERALLLDARWRLDPTDEVARVSAANLYRQLYERTPNVEYRDAHAFLTGVDLPPGSPLPSLPEALAGGTPSIGELLGTADAIVSELTGTADQRLVVPSAT